MQQVCVEEDTCVRVCGGGYLCARVWRRILVCACVEEDTCVRVCGGGCLCARAFRFQSRDRVSVMQSFLHTCALSIFYACVCNLLFLITPLHFLRTPLPFLPTQLRTPTYTFALPTDTCPLPTHTTTYTYVHQHTPRTPLLFLRALFVHIDGIQGLGCTV
jgi:hypothetical protein